MILHRAVAYQLQSGTTAIWQQQPLATVFFEVPVGMDCTQHLRALLGHVWGCPADEVEAYNVWSEPELLRMSDLPPAAGDARLLENGWYNGPLFCCPQRTLLLVRPLTQLRLLDARYRARPLQAQQLAAAGIAVGHHPAPVRRYGDVAARAEYEAVQSMGGHC